MAGNFIQGLSYLANRATFHSYGESVANSQRTRDWWDGNNRSESEYKNVAEALDGKGRKNPAIGAAAEGTSYGVYRGGKYNHEDAKNHAKNAGDFFGGRDWNQIGK